MRYWLMKSEPDSFSIDDLQRVTVEPWSGVRSHFARAYMRQMSVGDGVLFYHSSTEPPGVAGLARVERTNVMRHCPDLGRGDARPGQPRPGRIRGDCRAGHLRRAHHGLAGD
ncbi:MAG TPA: EVE domain-containing protein, partial [Kofleriaceae bacterium]